MTEMDQDLRTNWTSFAGMFGEDLAEPVFTDQPAPPGPRSSATHHANRRKAQEQADAHARLDDMLDRAAGQEADKAAYDRVMGERLNGELSTFPDKVRAARYARQAGIVKPMSSAARLAAQAAARRQWQPTGDDPNSDRAQRQRGRRPNRSTP